MSNEDLQNLLQTGIQAAQSGNRATARSILNQVVEQDPENDLAWIWLASVVDSIAERRECLQKALDINPANARAREALEKLKDIPAETVSRSPEPVPETPEEPPEPPEETLLRSYDHWTERERALGWELEPLSRRAWISMFVGLVAIAMIVAGLILLWNEIETQNEDTHQTQTANAVALARTEEQRIATITPLGGTPATLAPTLTLPPTWTPTATWTPTNTPLPTATLLPLTTYELLVSSLPVGESTWELTTLLADGSDKRTLRLNLDDENLALMEAYDAAYSPDGSQIVFTGLVRDAENAVEYQELFVVAARGGTARRLTNLRAENTQNAAWSPDGDQIAFASDQEGDFNIYLIAANDPDAGPPTPLTQITETDRSPAWSPDGEQIAFVSDRAGPGILDIWLMDANGDNPQRLTDSDNSNFAPAWSPDGTSLAFLTTRYTQTDLFVLDLDSMKESPVLSLEVESEERDPAWSPDGVWIAFSSNRSSPFFDLYVVRPDGSHLQQISAGDGDKRHPAWTP